MPKFTDAAVVLRLNSIWVWLVSYLSLFVTSFTHLMKTLRQFVNSEVRLRRKHLKRSNIFYATRQFQLIPIHKRSSAFIMTAASLARVLPYSRMDDLSIVAAKLRAMPRPSILTMKGIFDIHVCNQKIERLQSYQADISFLRPLKTRSNYVKATLCVTEETTKLSHSITKNRC